jgi:hypothetical protein
MALPRGRSFTGSAGHQGPRAFLNVSQCARGGCCFVQILDGEGASARGGDLASGGIETIPPEEWSPKFGRLAAPRARGSYRYPYRYR